MGDAVVGMKASVVAPHRPDDVDALFAGNYPFSRGLYLNILNEQAAWDRLRPILKVAYSEEGQGQLTSAGGVALTGAAVAAMVDRVAPWVDLTGGTVQRPKASGRGAGPGRRGLHPLPTARRALLALHQTWSSSSVIIIGVIGVVCLLMILAATLMRRRMKALEGKLRVLSAKEKNMDAPMARVTELLGNILKVGPAGYCSPRHRSRGLL